MAENSEVISVEEFERLVKEKEYKKATELLLKICDSNNYDHFAVLLPFDLQQELDITRYVSTRLAQIISELLVDEKYVINHDMFAQLILCKSLLAGIFASSIYTNADFAIAKLNRNNDIFDTDQFLISSDESSIRKFLLLYCPNSNIKIDLKTLWNINPVAASSLCFNHISQKVCDNVVKYSKKTKILQWLPNKLFELPLLTSAQASVSHAAYMFSSYDIAINKHDIKKGINFLIRQAFLQFDIKSNEIQYVGKKNNKPVMVVFLEAFSALHSIYRTHSTSLRAAKNYFHIIGIGTNSVDDIGREVFDEFVELTAHTDFVCVETVKAICLANKAAVFYMPALGMSYSGIFLSNIRLAPIQVMALGHPATTHSDCIDYVMVEDDYVGDEACFSEQLIRLPKDALPYVPSSATPEKIEYKRLTDTNPDMVHIGVASSVMKLNPFFLEACRAIRDRAKVKIKFHFALAGCSIDSFIPIDRFLKSYLGEDVIAYPSRPYKEYLEVLSHCDMCINPFPFGNTNGIIDMVTLGLVGVCKTGREVHEHIDEGLFRRLGLPDWLITKTADEYVAAAIRLAENHEERIALRKDIIQNNKLHTLFSGDPSPLGRILFEKVKEKFNLDEAEEIPDWDFEKEAAV